MAIKYPEQLVTPRWQRATAAAIAAEIVLVADAGSKVEQRARRTLLEIERQLAEAHELYHARRYRPAITAYQRVRSRIFAVLNSRHRPDVVVPDSFQPPLVAGLFDVLLHASVQIVEPLVPRTRPDWFVADVILPAFDDGDLADAAKIGMTVASGVPDSVRRGTDQAFAAAERGDWQRAAQLFGAVREQLGGPATEEARHASAALLLNQGAALAVAGDTGSAEELLRQADQGFAGLNDETGRAQAQANLATVFQRQGRNDDAIAALRTATELLEPTTITLGDGGGAGGGGGARGGGGVFGGNVVDRLMIGGRRRSNVGGIGPVRPVVGGGLEALPTAFDVFTPVAARASLDLGDLRQMAGVGGQAVTFRSPIKGEGWGVEEIESELVTGEKAVARRVGFMRGSEVVFATWADDRQQTAADLRELIYTHRTGATELAELVLRTSASEEFAAALPHLYHYVIPVALGDSHNAIGDFAGAEGHYLDAADYEFINTAIEVPALWRKIAENRLDWGDDLFREDEFQEARDVYSLVVNAPGDDSVTPRGAPLYAHAALADVGALVTAFLGDITDRPDELAPETAAVVLDIHARVLQLAAGLDFFGMPTTLVPIWTFDYLQSLARYFAQQAIQAERDYVNFQSQADQAAFTREQLVSVVKVADAETNAAELQAEAVAEEVDVYSAGAQLATLRRQNAQQNRNDYQAMSDDRIFYDAALAALGGGSDAIESELNKLANRLMEGKSLKGERGKLSGAVAMARARLTAEFELAAMQRQIGELAGAEIVAQEQLEAAGARSQAADAMAAAARQRELAAQANLQAFDNQTFTPDVWGEMARFMRGLSRVHLYRATRVARLMQQAYNFENDVLRKLIRSDYTGVGVAGLLAADALLADIDGFTFDLVNLRNTKDMPFVFTLSLATAFPFLFETEFRRTGRMDFQTRIEDVDLFAPGAYSRRIERIEVEVEGIVPRGGVSGVLTNAGISLYRTVRVDDVRVRIQPRESLILSEYDIRGDAVVFRVDERSRGIFEGAGISSTWTIDLPPEVNDLNYETITDVRITFYARARYDEGLSAAVRNELQALPGRLRRVRTFPLRWLHPDAFFGFQDTGTLEFPLEPLDFGLNELEPQVERVSLLLQVAEGTDPSGWAVRVATPDGGAGAPASPNADGEIEMADATHPWAPVASGAALGQWVVEIRPDENPTLVTDGALDLSPIGNVVLLLDYTYSVR